MRKFQDTLKEFVERLRKAGVFSPEKEAYAIFAHVLGRKASETESSWDVILDARTLKKATDIFERREKREPLARILGAQTFFGVEIKTSPDVYRPCLDAEQLVEQALFLSSQKGFEKPHILDLGTGTGCLLIALLHALPHATGIGVDIDERILEVARKNAEINGVQDRAIFVKSDWGKSLNEKFDLIVCNPPAVATANIPFLSPELRDYDPIASLDGGEDGLNFYRYIAKDFDRLAVPGGFGIFRVYSKKREAKIFQSAGIPVEIILTYYHEPYCIVATNIMNFRRWLYKFRAALGLSRFLNVFDCHGVI